MKHLITLVLIGLGAAMMAQGQSITISGVSSVAPTVIRAGTAVTLTGNSVTPPYRWVPSTANPAELIFTGGVSSITATVYVPVTGTYSITLRYSTNSSVTLTFSAVASNVSGVLPLPAQLESLIGQTNRAGTSLWNMQDFVAIGMADRFITLNATADYNGTDWDTASPGTITPTGTSITGIGTTLQTLFCNGGATPNGKELVIHYTVSGVSGRRNFNVASCTSETSIILTASPALEIPVGAGMSYGYLSCPGCWYGGSENVNYYDNVLAFYLVYYATGNTKYLVEARRLSDLWWRSPTIDRARHVTGGLAPPSRVKAYAGVMWWFVETSQPSNTSWDFMYAFLDTQLAGIGSVSLIGDVREDSYIFGWVAVAVILGPDAARVPTYRTALGSALTRWTTQQQAGGWWGAVYYGSRTGAVTGPGTVSVSNGSNIVTGTGTGWAPTICDTNSEGRSTFWVAYTSNGLTGDPVAYNCTWNSATQLTLTTPYAGTNNVSRFWNAGVLTGFGTQPFQVGLALTQMQFAKAATTGTTATGWGSLLTSGSNWILSNGRQSSTKGLYYARYQPQCEPDIDTAPIPNCRFNPSVSLPDGVEASRFVIGEILNISKISGINTTSVSELAGAALGYTPYTGPNTDGQGGLELLEVAGVGSPKRKDFGFYFGIGISGNISPMLLGPYVTTTATVNFAVSPGVIIEVRNPDNITSTCGAVICTYTESLGLLQYRVIRGGVTTPWRKWIN